MNSVVKIKVQVLSRVFYIKSDVGKWRTVKKNVALNLRLPAKIDHSGESGHIHRLNSYQIVHDVDYFV